MFGRHRKGNTMRHSSIMASGGVVVALLGVGAVSAGSAAAGSAAAGPSAIYPTGTTTVKTHSHSASPVGAYDFFDSGGGGPVWTIDSDGQWYDGSGDVGFWLQQGKTIALTVTSGTATGCTFLGTIKAKSLNTAAKQGIYNCAARTPPASWYATKAT
jgi:hypothetical protein